MSDLNVFSFTGKVGRDPSWKDGGTWQLASFPVANNIGWGDKKKTQWISVTCWGKLGDRANRFLKKGYTVAVSGEATIRIPDKLDRDGKPYPPSLDVKATGFEIINQGKSAAAANSDPYLAGNEETKVEAAQPGEDDAALPY